jgi:CRP-like cAMP-binding protein
MANPLTLKMEQFTRFDPVERQRLNDLLSFPTKSYDRGETILREGEKVNDIHLVLTGFAARSKILLDGSRQIMAFLLPGDLCDVEVFILEAMDHDIEALGKTTCVLIPAKVVEDLLTESSRLTKALWWSTMTDSAILRERIIDHGRREARERIAHLCYELLVRFRIVAETTDDSYPLPATQQDIADATGLTPVHVNRMLQSLRSEGIIELKNNVLTVLDPERLKQVAQYDAKYLHLIRTERRDTEVSERAGDLVLPPDQGLLHNAVEKVKSAFKKGST